MWIDVIGIFGVSLIVIAYFLLQKGSILYTSKIYLALNGIGSILILFTLYFDWNLSAVLIEGFWIAISVYGYIKNIKGYKK